MSNDIQKDDYYIPGSLGTIGIGGDVREVSKVVAGKDGAITFTIGKKLNTQADNTEDADFDVLPPKGLPLSKEAKIKECQKIIDSQIQFTHVMKFK